MFTDNENVQIACMSSATTVNLLFIYYEYRQIKMTKWVNYIKDYWNLVDLML